MSGLELLKEELKKRRFSKTQIESPVVAGVLDILANTGTNFSDYSELIKRNEDLLRAIELQQRELEERKRILKDRELKCINIFNDLFAYAEKFNQSLHECESDEGRDAMRAAQLFCNVVMNRISTPQNNTAFIYGLACILAGKEIPEFPDLKSIPEMLPKEKTPVPRFEEVRL